MSNGNVRTEFEELQIIVGELSKRLQDLKMWVVRNETDYVGLQE